MADISVSIKGCEKVIEKLLKKADPNAIRQAVMLNGSEIQQEAMRTVRVDTGQLKRSIRLDIEDNGYTAVISANTDYAAYIEYGTRFMKQAYPYLRPALEKQVPQFISDLERIGG